MLPQWLDAHLPPPWSGLAMLAILAVPIGFSGYVGVRTVLYFLGKHRCD